VNLELLPRNGGMKKESLDIMEVTIFSRISALKSFSLETSQGKWADTCSLRFGAKEGQFKLRESS
jgi:hypothetical protein